MNLSDFVTKIKTKRLTHLKTEWEKACAEAYPEPFGIISNVTFKRPFSLITDVYYAKPGIEVKVGSINPIYTTVSRKGVATAFLASKGIIVHKDYIILHTVKVSFRIPSIIAIKHDAQEGTVTFYYNINTVSSHVFSIKNFEFLLQDILELLGGYLWPRPK